MTLLFHVSDPEMYRQFMEKADEYVKEFYVNKSKKRTDEQIVITLKVRTDI